jgi:hypothetical protein
MSGCDRHLSGIGVSLLGAVAGHYDSWRVGTGKGGCIEVFPATLNPAFPGERRFALMSQRWSTIQHVSVRPTTIGDIVKSVLVPTQFEHKMIN